MEEIDKAFNYLIQNKDNDNEKNNLIKISEFIIKNSNEPYKIEFCKKIYFDLLDTKLVKYTKKPKKDIIQKIKENDLEYIINLKNKKYNYNIHDKNGNTPLHICIQNNDTSMLKELLKYGMSIDTVNKKGETLLEYACRNNPNIIYFLIHHGANTEKHEFFRFKNIKAILKIDNIDIANIFKICLMNDKKENRINLDFLYKYINKHEPVGVNELEFKDFLPFLEKTISQLSNDEIKTVCKIWKEELSYELRNDLGCPNNKIELLLTNLVPFITYPFNFTNKNIIQKEMLYLIKKNIKENNYNIDNELDIKLIEELNERYENIIEMNYIGVLLYEIMNKIKIFN